MRTVMNKSGSKSNKKERNRKRQKQSVQIYNYMKIQYINVYSFEDGQIKKGI